MPSLSVWQPVLVNKSKRPILIKDEHNLCIQNGIGLYQGRLKIKNYQNGRLYLTNKRIIWLDSQDKQDPIAIHLSDFSRAEFVEGFLRSSPKVKAYLKDRDTGASSSDVGTPDLSNSARVGLDPSNSTSASTGGSGINGTNGGNSGIASSGGIISSNSGTVPKEVFSVNWVCVICLFNNQLNSNTDISSLLPACVSCGILPARNQLEKVIQEAEELSSNTTISSTSSTAINLDSCPKCTFVNHPSMQYCEMCGSALRLVSSSLMKRLQSLENLSSTSIMSANPLGLVLEDKEEYTHNAPYVKFSFRKGGDSTFFKHLIEQIQALQWSALEAKGGLNGNATKLTQFREPSPQKDLVGGIRGLERLDEQKRKQNEMVLSLSLEDLEQLMYKAQDILGLASTFQTIIKPLRSSWGNSTTIMPPLVFNKSSSLYHQELARHISEFLLNFELTSITSMITLQDLFASYNRFLILRQGFGTELVTPLDLSKSLDFFQKLDLPVRMKTYLSGLTVIARRAHDLQSLHQAILLYVLEEENTFTYQKFRSELLADNDGYMRDKYRAFHGLTVSQIADHYGWSPAVCVEELDRCIDEQLLVTDKNILGIFYFANIFDLTIAKRLKDEKTQRTQAQGDVSKEQRLISEKLKKTYEADQNLLRFTDFGFGDGEDLVSDKVSNPSPAPTLPETFNQLSGLKF